MTAIAFTQTEERKQIVNFTSIAIEPYSLLVSRPRELSRALLFLLPFSVDTWLCIVAVILILGPLLNFVHRTSPFYQHYRSLDRGGFSKLVNCLWYLYGALLQQGGSSLPAADSGRLVVATWWLSVVVMATTYSGNLVAFLTFPKMETKVSNLDQLLQRRHEFTWGMPAASTVHDVLKRANTDKLNQISKRAELHSEMTPQILDRIRYNNHVYIDRKSRLLFTMKRDFLATGICDFSLGKEEFLEEHLGIMMLPGNPYFKIINKEIGRMHRVGLISKWTRDYMPKKDKCWNFNPLYTNGVDNHTVNLSDMQGSFFVLILGKICVFVLPHSSYLKIQVMHLILTFVNYLSCSFA
ncbi:hypothetical protein AAG570_002977 [Ranatra chinensis]|uniref:Ionotropic glutamate receptor C-terminal domain-containing protein n=1 Tax=Ranatra chinensis TaxID=642074 RepID=A0ABD0Y5I3_9HEMI